ncbi:MAG: metallophosphoesterase [Planctomycetota bacterium]
MLIAALFFQVIGLTISLSSGQVKTPFEEANALAPPVARDGFTFAILADRTGGPESGLAILERAVEELNHLDPDLVMTVGDLINGYNPKEEWLGQMKEFKAIVSRLKMPWYPTAGNHDVYPPGRDKNDRTNENLYLRHFGPLYYSFDHKGTHFVVLYSDEHLSYSDPPKDQQMSSEQLAWLEADLEATPAKHAFVFLHHPRWNYAGDVWEPVHAVLKKSGKVKVVFAGHWHRYRSDGERDGIRYYCLATTGAHQDPYREAGFLHHYNLVTVRDDGFSMAVLPVGSVLDPDFVTGQESNDVYEMCRGEFFSLESTFPAPVDEPVTAGVIATVNNPASKTLTFDFSWAGLPEEGWIATPPTLSLSLKPGQAMSVKFALTGVAAPQGEPLAPVSLEVGVSYPLNKGGRQTLRTVRELAYDVPPMPEALTRDVATPEKDRALVLDGIDDCVIVEHHERLNFDGPFTLECWAKLKPPGERVALVAKTQGSSYGLWLADGDRREPSFFVYFESRGYVSPGGKEEDIHIDRWAHYAGVFDGSRVRTYVNGICVGEEDVQGDLRMNELPFIVGADVEGGGRPVSFAEGRVDEVRLSAGARYEADFTPQRRFQRDDDTRLLLHFDRVFGDRTPDTSGSGCHGRFSGGARLVEVARKGLK